MDPSLRALAEETIGFMPEKEGLELYRHASEAAASGPLVEIGSYCGKSTIYLAAGVRDSGSGSVLFSIDHHRGSEEHQPGEEYHDPRLVDPEGRVDTLDAFRKTIARSGLGDFVVVVVATSSTAARRWATPVSFVFIDGGHSRAAAIADYQGWTPHLVKGGLLAIHDVFPDPTEGGRPPFEIYSRALGEGFEEIAQQGSLRVLRRTG